MKLSEYIEKFGDKQVDVDKLSEFIIEDKVFEPKENEKYYFVDVAGKVSWYFNDKSIDKNIINSQQVYRTEAETEFARDKAIFLEFMRKEFLRNSDVIDWEKNEQKKLKFSLAFNYDKNEVIVDWDRSIKKGGFYTTSRKWLKDFLEEHEDDIKKYYFEVEA